MLLSIRDFYYHHDRLNSTDYLTNNVTGKVTSYVTYDDWGELTMKAILKMGVRQLDLVTEYTGYMYDQVLSAYYAKARMYDASNRRFMAVDPVKGTVSDPQTMVQYTYCLDNPVKYVDPLGLAVSDWDKANLNSKEIKAIQDATDAWNAAHAKGDKDAMAAAHDAAEKVREPKRTGTEYGTDDGSTKGEPAPKAPVEPTPPKPDDLEELPQEIYESISDAINSMDDNILIIWAEETGGEWAEMAAVIIANANDINARNAAINVLRQKAIVEAARDLVNGFGNAGIGNNQTMSAPSAVYSVNDGGSGKSQKNEPTKPLSSPLSANQTDKLLVKPNDVYSSIFNYMLIPLKPHKNT